VIIALSSWWIVGWIIGAAVVVVAAALLLTIIVIGRRIAGQADDITRSLDRTRENTTPMFDLTRTNLAIDQTTRGLRAVREGRQG
jgi:hypothetical protein